MKTYLEQQKDAIREFAQSAKDQGFDAYIAGRGTYGFYTNGNRVISFQFALSGGIALSGNYRPNGNGTGWGITDNATHESIKAAIETNAPHWANPNPTYTTQEQYLKDYQASSKFEKI